DAEWGRVDCGVGHGVQRRAGLRLLLSLSALPARVRRVAPVLSGASDPRCKVPDHAARRAGAGLRGAVAGGVAAVVRGDPPAGATLLRRLPESTGGSTNGGVALWDA